MFHIPRLRTAALCALCLSTPPAFAQQLIRPISWALLPPDCDVEDPAVRSFRAGDFGVLHFGPRPFTGCGDGRGPAVSCTEPVRVYPPPGPAPLENLACDPQQTGCGKTFDAMAGAWIYILDHGGWHGSMVDAVVRDATASQVDTLLAQLTEHFPGLYEGIGDPDVAIALAALAQAIDRDGTPRPSVINMSFGREHEISDPLTADARSAACSLTACGEGALSCLIAHLLAYLTRPLPDGTPSTVAVAADGNDRVTLFPSGLEEVVSVGMLDATTLGAGVPVRPAWETPTAPDALMPGNGLCLELLTHDPQDPDHGTTGQIETAAPAGSSFSAAFFSGWIGDLLQQQPDVVRQHLDQGPLWLPRKNCDLDSCPYQLLHGGAVFGSPSGNGDALMREAVEHDPGSCGPPDGGSLPNVLLTRAPYNPETVLPSLVELTARTHRPAPEANPCIPCVLDEHSPLQGPADPEAAGRRGSASGPRRTLRVDLDIDLHGVWQLDRDLTLWALFLRIGSERKLVDLSWPQLQEIADGRYGYLHVYGDFATLDLGEQPSLISVLSRTDRTGRPEFFWRSTAMVLRP